MKSYPLRVDGYSSLSRSVNLATRALLFGLLMFTANTAFSQGEKPKDRFPEGKTLFWDGNYSSAITGTGGGVPETIGAGPDPIVEISTDDYDTALELIKSYQKAIVESVYNDRLSLEKIQTVCQNYLTRLRGQFDNAEANEKEQIIRNSGEADALYWQANRKIVDNDLQQRMQETINRLDKTYDNFSSNRGQYVIALATQINQLMPDLNHFSGEQLEKIKGYINEVMFRSGPGVVLDDTRKTSLEAVAGQIDRILIQRELEEGRN